MALITIKEFALKVCKCRSAIRARIKDNGLYPRSHKKVSAHNYAYLYELSELEKITFYATSGRPKMNEKQLADRIYYALATGNVKKPTQQSRKGMKYKVKSKNNR